MRADRGQCDYNSAPGQRLKLASKTGLVTAAQFAHIVATVLIGLSRSTIFRAIKFGTFR